MFSMVVLPWAKPLSLHLARVASGKSTSHTVKEGNLQLPRDHGCFFGSIVFACSDSFWDQAN